MMPLRTLTALLALILALFTLLQPAHSYASVFIRCSSPLLPSPSRRTPTLLSAATEPVAAVISVAPEAPAAPETKLLSPLIRPLTVSAGTASSFALQSAFNLPSPLLAAAVVGLVSSRE